MLRTATQPAARVPGPRGSFLVGSLPALLRDTIGTYERTMAEYGDIARLTVGPPGLRREVYFVFHPDGVHQVLAGGRASHTKRTPVFTEVAEVFGTGLLTSEGELWRRQRRLVQPLFTQRRVDGYAGLMADEAAAVVRRWRALPAGTSVAAHPDMIRLSLRVVGRAIFGRDVDAAIPVLDWAFPRLSRRAYRRGISPVRVPASWPTPGNRGAASAREALYGVVDRLISQRRSEAAAGEDLLGLLLAARHPETGAAMDDQQVRDEALIFLLAGHETTAAAMTFALHLLGGHPPVQREVQDEVDRVLARRAPTAADLAALPLTTCMVKEALRLYPPAYATARVFEAAEDVCGHVLPSGSLVVVSPWCTHRHTGFWADPDRFDPSRFTPDREAARHRYAYLPFGGGPRACIGEHFAMLEAVITLATVAQQLELASPAGPVRPRTDGISLRPPVGLLVRVRPR